MNYFNSEFYNDGEWNEKEDLFWKESDWKKYLEKIDIEITHFLNFYREFKDVYNRLDMIALRMGWDLDEWSSSEWDETADMASSPLKESEDLSAAEDELEDLEPDTFYRHPTFIITRALYKDLSRIWETFMHQNDGTLNPSLVWQFALSLHSGETNAILAIQALDMEDYPLTIHHLKQALSALNTSLSSLQKIKIQDPPLRGKLNTFKQEAQIRIFDLRELWLRAMGVCRDEIQDRSNEGG